MQRVPNVAVHRCVDGDRRNCAPFRIALLALTVLCRAAHAFVDLAIKPGKAVEYTLKLDKPAPVDFKSADAAAPTVTFSDDSRFFNKNWTRSSGDRPPHRRAGLVAVGPQRAGGPTGARCPWGAPSMPEGTRGDRAGRGALHLGMARDDRDPLSLMARRPLFTSAWS